MTVRVAFVVFALIQSSTCGFEPADPRGEGEPCVRSSECESRLVCAAGVCAVGASDGGGFDAASRDAGRPFRDSGLDAGAPCVQRLADAGADAAFDGSLPDADIDSGDAGDAGNLDDAGINYCDAGFTM